MKILVYANSQAGEMTIGEFLDEAKRIYNEYFPNSECIAVNRKVMGMEYIQITWLLSSDVSECISNIRDNDMFFISFNIDIKDTTESGRLYDVAIRDNSSTNDRLMPPMITMEVMRKSYLTKPDISYMAYGRRELPFRKTKGTPEKILATLEKYAKKLHDQLVEDMNNDVIHDHHIDLLKSKI